MEVSERTLTHGYLVRRAYALNEIIDSVPVFSKRYDDAIYELEEIESLLGWDSEKVA